MRKLMVAVPTHSYSITVETALTLLNLQTLAHQQGMEVRVTFHSASIISQLRNTIVADFLASDATDLFMLDSDQGLNAHLILHMLNSPFPVAGVLYPRRNFAWSQYSPERPVQGIGDVLLQGYRFVGSVLPDEQGKLVVRDGFVRAEAVGTGALLIRREALDLLRQRYPELHGQGFPVQDETLGRAEHNWGFFNPLVKAQDGRNAGEDIGFCQRWRDCGGELWADVSQDTVHVGRFVFQGNWLAHASALGLIK